MKNVILFASILLAFNAPLQAQDIQEIDSLLTKAYKQDQKVRAESLNLMNRLNNVGADNISAETVDSLMMLQEQTQIIDKENQLLIASILKNGLPKGLSPQSYKAIWLIIDHADLKLQKVPANHGRSSMQKLISANDFAVLTDRICMKEGKPQKYGTQSYTVTSEGKQVIYIWPVEDARKLNTLRNEIGAGDIETYVQMLKTTVGCEVIYDPELTVSQMKKMGLLNHKSSE